MNVNSRSRMFSLRFVCSFTVTNIHPGSRINMNFTVEKRSAFILKYGVPI